VGGFWANAVAENRQKPIATTIGDFLMRKYCIIFIFIEVRINAVTERELAI
jgi:hypothetical protein